jgi:hypothetical protein
MWVCTVYELGFPVYLALFSDCDGRIGNSTRLFRALRSIASGLWVESVSLVRDFLQDTRR